MTEMRHVHREEIFAKRENSVSCDLPNHVYGVMEMSTLLGDEGFTILHEVDE